MMLDELLLELDVTISPAGDPAPALVVLQLDEWANEPAARIAAAADAVARALPLTIGVLRQPPDALLRPLLEAVTLTLATAHVPDSVLQVVQVPDLDRAVALLRSAVAANPGAGLACGQLLRQTVHLDTDAGLAAEAAVYSMLLAGPEFARWLAGRAPRAKAATAAGPLVLLDRADGRLSITLNEPRRRNALSFAMREELLMALRLAEFDPGITEVSIGGAGPALCSGGDLGEFGTATDLVAAYLVRLAHAPWRVIDRLAGRVTVRAHGACIGAGAEMTAFAGRVIAAPDAVFALPEVGMGLVPGAGGTVSVPRRVGRWRAAWLMLTGQSLDAVTALRWGLVDACE
jgi:enoyl-CoA hydratase/carnithine racemase